MPTITDDPRYKVYDELMTTARKADKLEFSLYLRKENAQAEAVRAANIGVYQKVDEVLASLMKSWSKGVKAELKAMHEANTELQKSLESIRRSKEIGEKVVDAIGQIEKVVEAAAKVLAKLA
ncbi:hypothetical protein OT109_05060 [Phycisphaeraceae bacterium D3-23]